MFFLFVLTVINKLSVIDFLFCCCCLFGFTTLILTASLIIFFPLATTLAGGIIKVPSWTADKLKEYVVVTSLLLLPFTKL